MKKLVSMWKSASIETKQRTVIFFVTWIFSIYALISSIINNGMDMTTIQSLVATIVTGAASVLNWWKNNSFSDAAIKADQYKDILKTVDEDDDIIEEDSEHIELS